MKIKSILLLLLSLNTTTTVAEEMRWSIKGFGTFGYIGTDTDTIGFRRSNTQSQDTTDSGGITTDSRLGVQLSVDINRSVHATVQWVARDISGDFFEQNLDWAFLRWNFTPTSTIRAGRLALDLFFLSDHRDVGYAYPWMRPPHEFYNNIALRHFDGFDFNHKIHFNDDTLSIKLFAGHSFNQIRSTLFSNSTDIKTPLVGGNVKFESQDWKVRAGYAYIQVINNLPTEKLFQTLNDPMVNMGIPGIKQVIPSFQLKGRSTHYYSLGGAYDNGSWITQAEISYMDTDTPLFPDAISSYLSIGKRISKVTVYSLFGISRSFQKTIHVPSPVIPSPQLQYLSHIMDRTINKNGIDEKSISLGARWDFHPNFALKTQWSHYWLGKNGTQFWQDSTLKDKSREVNVWSLGIDFTF